MDFGEMEEALAKRRLVVPPGLRALVEAPVFDFAEPWLVRTIASSVDDMFDLLGLDAPENLLPIAAVDEESFACVVCPPVELPDDAGAGLVVRWHLRDVPPRLQAQILDVGVVDYVSSLDEELAARDAGLKRILDEIGPAYEEAFISNEKRPRDFVVRPIRIACQNVIVGLAAIAQDSTFDGLSVVAWQTCEVPHVATHEGNRALAALMLADAFQNGGTMEIRFDRPARVGIDGEMKTYDGHPERAVPASLRRFGRTVGVALGVEDPASISPAEARALFLAVTPMPDALRVRVMDAVTGRGITPERLCFTLMSQLWREIELDFILACSHRAGSILEGGADWRARSIRQGEMEVCRAALMAGMYFRRLNGRDTAGAMDEARVVEDVSLGVQWQILDDTAGISFKGVDLSDGTPWATAPAYGSGDSITIFPRFVVTEAFMETLTAMRTAGDQVALVVPRDGEVPADLRDVPLLRCPDRTADLDRAVEGKLLTSRISRG